MILQIIIRNLLYKPLGTLLSVVLLMFGAGIISLLLLVQKQVEAKFDNDLKDIDLVVGAKGSPLQLVLSAVYHVDAPTGNIKQAEVDKLKRNPLVEQIIPLAYGDSYKGYRILGTTEDYLEKYDARLAYGKMFGTKLQAVAGSQVAKLAGLKPGTTFVSNHGGDVHGQEHEAMQYEVTGVLAPTNTVLDNLILTNIETVWAVHAEHGEAAVKADTVVRNTDTAAVPATPPGPADLMQNVWKVRKASPQEKHGGTHTGEAGGEPEQGHDITAALIKTRSDMGTLTLPRFINENTNMMAAAPVLEMNRLMNLMGIGISTMQGVAAAIMIISALSVFIALYNRLKERKYEQALMRSMGCSRGTILYIILAEGLLLALAGFLLGVILSRLGLLLLNRYAAKNFHLTFNATLIKEELVLLLITIGVGLLAALLPAIKAFRLNISKTLAHA